MGYGTGAQYQPEAEFERVGGSVTGPLDLGDAEVKRVTLEIEEGTHNFLRRYAAYRNALASAQDKRLRQTWSAKSMAESFVRAQSDAAHQQLREMFAALGEFPEITGNKTTDDKAMEKYAAAVLAWSAKHK